MFRRVCSLAFAAICASSVLASAQVTLSPTGSANANSSSPATAAYLYVSNSPSSVTNEIYGASVDSNGALTKISGSPWHTTDSFIALNGAWLFATDGVNIDSWAIGSNGSLSLADSYADFNGGGGPINLVLDHTGADLYAGYENLQGTGNNGYQTFSINQSTGAITLLNSVGFGPQMGNVLSFVGSDQYAYTSACFEIGPFTTGFRRNSDGTLTNLNLNQVYPTPPPGDFYCPILAAANPTNYLAIAVQPYTASGVVAGPYQLATYSVDSAGNLSTNSTYSNMPSVLVGSVNDYKMSPSGTYLAVGGTSGLQIFKFNGSNPITKLTGLLTNAPIDQLFWDNSNHLFAISRTGNALFVFVSTANGVKQAQGSPHQIKSPQNLIVLPK